MRQRSGRGLVWLAGGMVVGVALAIPVRSGADTLFITDDSYVDAGSVNGTNGGRAFVTVTDSTKPRIGLVRFDLSALPDASLDRVTLRLWIQAVSHAGSVSVRPVLGPWAEETVTWNTRPTIGGTALGAIPLSAASVSGWVSLDVTAQVEAWRSGQEPNNGLALVPADAVNAQFASKEDVHWGSLEAAPIGPPGSDGPPGPAGPQGPTGPPGPAGLQGQSVVGASLPVGDADCPTGGSVFSVGGDVTYACNGATGPPGPEGAAGATGATGSQGATGPAGESVFGASLAPGDAHCPAGGSAFTVVGETTYACNGAAGEPGAPGASVAGVSLPPGDPNCPAGGSAFSIGAETTYACNGLAGPAGPPGSPDTPGQVLAKFNSATGDGGQAQLGSIGFPDPRHDFRWGMLHAGAVTACNFTASGSTIPAPTGQSCDTTCRNALRLCTGQVGFDLTVGRAAVAGVPVASFERLDCNQVGTGDEAAATDGPTGSFRYCCCRPCSPSCGAGDPCATGADCLSGSCSAGRCASSVIARGAYDDYGISSGVTSHSRAFDSGPAAAGRFLVLVVQVGVETVDLVTGATYGGVTLQLLAKRQKTNSQGNGFDYFFGAANPPIGSNNIVISSNAPMNHLAIVSVVYTRVAPELMPPVGAAARGVDSGDFSVQVTTRTDNSWIVAASSDNNGLIQGVNGAVKLSTVRAAGAGAQVFDSGGPTGPAATRTLTVTGVNGGGQDLFAIALAPQ